MGCASTSPPPVRPILEPDEGTAYPVAWSIASADPLIGTAPSGPDEFDRRRSTPARRPCRRHPIGWLPHSEGIR